MKIPYIFTVCLAIVCFSASAKEDEKKEKDKDVCQVMENKKALKAYAKGTDRKYEKSERVGYLLDALKLEPNYLDANYAFAMERIKTLTLDDIPFKPADEYFKKVIDSCPDYHSNCYYFLGFSAYEQEEWELCSEYFQKYIDFMSDDDKKFHKNYEIMLRKADQIMYFADFYKLIYGNPVPFEPQPLDGVCTEFAEYLPMIAPDDKTLYFTRKVPHYQKYGLVSESDREDELFSFSKRDSKTGKFAKGGPMKNPFNKGSNEGGATISINNKHLYFTICDSDNCDIYYSDYSNGQWSQPEQCVGVNDPNAWDSQPTLASDGKTLYFCSNRPGGYGGVDIYKTVKDYKLGVWSKPENLGRPVNTRGDELSPFMHSDFSSLYFSSDGHLGIGGQDIFYTRMGDSTWSKPTNIGVPINTEGDDMGFFVSTDGKKGYFSSDIPSRTKGKSVGRHDVYWFDLYEAARPDEIMFVTGKLSGNSSGGEVSITDKDNNKTDAIVDSISGEYMAIVNVKKKKDLVVNVKKENGAFSSKLITKETVQDAVADMYAEDTSKVKKYIAHKPVLANLRTDSIKVGQTYRLNDIYYSINSSTIAKESEFVIDEFVEYMQDNPTITVAIHGHTDNEGRNADNLKLSNARASTVQKMIIEKGVDSGRIKGFKGFGASKPVASNETEAGRAINRRTEFLIISK